MSRLEEKDRQHFSYAPKITTWFYVLFMKDIVQIKERFALLFAEWYQNRPYLDISWVALSCFVAEDELMCKQCWPIDLL